MVEGVLDANREFLRIGADTTLRPFDFAAMTQNAAAIAGCCAASGLPPRGSQLVLVEQIALRCTRNQFFSS